MKKTCDKCGRETDACNNCGNTFRKEIETIGGGGPELKTKQGKLRAYLLFHNGPRKGKTIRLRIMSHKASGGLIQTQFPPSLKIEPGEEYEIYFAWSKKK